MNEFQKHLTNLRASPDYDQVREPVEEMLASDDENYVSGIEKELLKSYGMYANILTKSAKSEPPLMALRFYWAGSEVSPYVPSTVWGDGFSDYEWKDGSLKENVSIFKETGGFDLGIMDDFLLELVEDDEIQDLDLFDDLKWTFIRKTFLQATEALKRTVESDEFRALSRHSSFLFLGTGGHDEDTVILFKVDD